MDLARLSAWASCVIALLALTGCYTQPSLVRDGEVYDGILRIGFEVFSFTPCGSGEAWMVSGNRKNDDTIAKLVEDYEALKQKEYDDVFVRLRGTPSKEGQYGHMNMYRRAFYLKEIIKIRRRGSMDCN